ncbi:hypothetical protein F3087_42575 [Nocardia colli]|uniref:Uncharacterized protein n=1 Tax=Nocardia colli TaxID=2545717 RepID=A0A5N0DTH9_9NOCA|nr:hypothetical protein [Nocardia colli]KAA8880093.1 hypothetical protein F3087_42575 [Nocardia colli]
MVFVGRTDLLELIDNLITIPATSAAATPKPVLVVEGCGGSGRTAVLNKVLEKWQGHTPSVLVRPLELPFNVTDPVRTVLAAVMLGLSVDIPGYAVAFPRVLIAQIVIAEDFSGLTTQAQLERLTELLDRYQDRAALMGFVRDLIEMAGALAANINVPGVGVIPPGMVNRLAGALVGRLMRGRLLSRFTWRPKAAWFGHQDLGLLFNWEPALIGLSRNARSTDPAIRRDVDDVLVGALLADLRHSVAKVGRRTSNVLVLIDDGDAPAAASFTGSLLRVRESIAAVGTGLTDPLTVVTTSSGVLVDELAGQVPPPAVWTAPLDPARIGTADAPWARVRLPELSERDVRLMAKEVDQYQSERIGESVYRLTRGHPAATDYLLRRIKRERDLLGDLDALLRSPGPEAGTTVEQYLLRIFGRGLSVHKLLRRELATALVTVSAARGKNEALGLVALLPGGVEHDSPFYKSRSLWAPAAPGAEEKLPALARLLGLRALHARTDGQGWAQVLGRLRDGVAADDQASRLHHARLLDGRGAVVGELAEKLPQLASSQWLRLFDEIVETPDPGRRDSDLIDGPGRPRSLEDHIAVLVALVPAFESDIRISAPEQKSTLCSRIAHSYEQVSDHAPDSAPFLLRATRYRRLANQFQ